MTQANLHRGAAPASGDQSATAGSTYTITAAVLRAHDAPFQLEQLRLKGPQADEILVRIVGAGMCHTDSLARRPGPFAQPPIVLGHEGAGIVEAVGEGVDEIAVGDHVVLSFDSCGSCGNCRGGHPAYCATFWRRNLGGSSSDGHPPAVDTTGAPVAARWFGQSSFATHALASRRNAVVVDRSLPLELLGPLGCSIQTGAASISVVLGVTAGARVAVFGTGSVGLAAVMAARAVGATTIVAVDPQPKRRELALELGATHALDPAAQDASRQLRRIAPGGLDAALDTTGQSAVIDTAIGALRLRGQCGLVGVPRGELTLSRTAVSTGRSVTGILQGDAVPQQFIPSLIELWRQDRLPFERLITKYSLADINEAERAVRAGEVVKPVLLPGT
jgi:aryl-alcohol dehydrogenase